MKLISAFILAAACLVGIASWSYIAPAFKPNGTSVISVSGDTRGGKPISIKVPDNLTAKQHKMLNFAYSVAQRDGHKYPPYIQGVLWQESMACGLKDFRVAGMQNKANDRYFGCMQIKVAAAKDVLSRFPDMWKLLETKTDEEIQARLILDDEFNIRFGSKYLLMMGINDNPSKAITAYNQGLGGAKTIDSNTWHYTVKVKQHTQRLQPKKPAKSALQANLKTIGEEG